MTHPGRTASGSAVRVGLLSDTHGKLDPAAMRALAGVDAIIHAGDIGGAEIVYELSTIAPVTAVLGNTDSPMPGLDLGAIANVAIGGRRILVVHDVTHSGYVPEDVEVVVHGHTHKPQVLEVDGRLYVNPGSTSRSRGYGHTVAVLTLDDGKKPTAEIVSIDQTTTRRAPARS